MEFTSFIKISQSENERLTINNTCYLLATNIKSWENEES